MLEPLAERMTRKELTNRLLPALQTVAEADSEASRVSGGGEGICMLVFDSTYQRRNPTPPTLLFERSVVLALIKVFGLGVVIDVFMPFMIVALADKLWVLLMGEISTQLLPLSTLPPNYSNAVRKAAVRGFGVLLAKCGPGLAARFVLRSLLRTISRAPPNLAPLVKLR